jgi:PKD repeat protein
MPVSANGQPNVLTISNTTTGGIQGNINVVADGGTLILEPGTYFENDITFSQNITIEADTANGGNPTNTIIDGSGGYQGIFVADGGVNSLTIDNLTLQNGAMSSEDSGTPGGGAIYTYNGNVTVTSSVISNCFSITDGGAIYTNDGNVTVISSTISGCMASYYGGAIFSDDTGTITVISSTITNCSAVSYGSSSYGGAIASEGSGAVTVISSTISNCSAGNVAMSSYGYGGAIASEGSGAVTVISSTISNCNAILGYGGAIDTYDGNVMVSGSSTISGCTASYYGGAISSDDTGTITVTSSTITNCSVGNEEKGSGPYGYGGAIASEYMGTVMVTSSTIANCTANLGNGGAIDTIYGNVMVSGSSTISGCMADGNGGAIASDYTGTITVTSSTISNCSAGNEEIDSYGIGGAIETWGGNVTVTSSNISNSMAVSGGGAIASDAIGGAITVSSSTISNCSASSNDGGAILAFDSDVIVNSSSTISDCSAFGYGGAIASDASTEYSNSTEEPSPSPSTVTLDSAIISNCMSGSDGGAIASENTGMITVTSSTIANCTSAGDGGAIASENTGTITVTSSTIANCTSAGDGGAIASENTGTITVTSSTISNSTATFGNGGGIKTYDGNVLESSSSMITDCTAGNSGGAIASEGVIDSSSPGPIWISSSTISNSTATFDGGAIDTIDGDVSVTSSSTITGCTAGNDGGAIASESAGAVTVTSSSISNCSAFNEGGAVCATSGTISFSRLVDDDTGGTVLSGVGNATSALDATDNWWGTNNPSSSLVNGELISYYPWLVLGITASPSSITASGTSTIQANLTFDSMGIDTSTSGYVPDGIPITYALTGVSGSLQPLTGNTSAGVNTTIFRPSAGGMATIGATVDGQTVSMAVDISGGSSPAVTGITPASGSTAGDTLITITGTGFSGATDVYFGTTDVPSTSFIANTDTQIVLESPAGITGIVNVTVKTPAGTSATSASDQFTYAPQPFVEFVTPASGPTAGGTSVMILGYYFTGVTGVSFGSTPAASYTVDSGTQITATAPAHAAGTVQITVTTPGGPSTGAEQFTYIAPVISFTATPTSGTAPLTVQFTDLSTGAPTGWAWFFGDENYSEPWTLMNVSAGWSGRSDFSSVVMPDGSIVLMGGGSNGWSIVYNDVWRSTDDGVTWTEVNTSAGWSPRYGQNSVTMPDSSIVLMGGYNSTGGYENDTWRSMDDGATWTEINASAGWSGRSDFSSVVMPDGSIVLMGGGSNGWSIVYNDVWRSTDDGVTWTEVNTSAGWSPRYGQNSVTMPDSSIVLMGGYNSTGGYENDTWRLNPVGSSVQNPSYSYIAPGNYTVALTAYNAGGYNSTLKIGYINVTAATIAPVASFTTNITSGTVPLTVVFNDTSTNSPTSWNWSFGDGSFSILQNVTHTYLTAGSYTVSLNTTNAGGSNTTTQTNYIVVRVPSPVAGFSVNVTSGTAPLAVQFNDASTGSPTGWAWFFGDENYTQPWTQQTTSGGWSPRAYQSSAVMPDGSIVLMGGTNGTSSFNDTWKSTDKGATWTKMTGHAQWSARNHQKSVVMPDGSIILIGGVGGGSSKNDTWKSTDEGTTWTQLTASAGWPARYAFSSVVMPDGSIIIFAGYDGTSYYNDVWRSIDEGMTWTEISAGAPWSARSVGDGHVMTDGSIVMIGGSNSGGDLNDTWRSTDEGATWTLMNSSAGWAVRNGHSSVVMPDGSIVLMGGFDGTNYYNDTWRSTDEGATWMEVNTSAGWSARCGQNSKVMPDGSVVLFGGKDGSGYKNDVWQFQPAGSSYPNPTHTYITGGVYNVTLQAYNSGGYNSTHQLGYITVNAAPSITVSINGYIPAWALSVGSNVNVTAIAMNVTSNANWAVSTVDNLDAGKPTGTAGQMAEWDGTDYIAGGRTLSLPLNVTAGTNPYQPLSGTGTQILSGIPIPQTTYPVKIEQIVKYGDSTLSEGHQYHIVITFTGSLT